MTIKSPVPYVSESCVTKLSGTGSTVTVGPESPMNMVEAAAVTASATAAAATAIIRVRLLRGPADSGLGLGLGSDSTTYVAASGTASTAGALFRCSSASDLT